jgi:small-conductance mechanosensitive channel
MKKIIEIVLRDLQNKTSTDGPVITGRGVQIFTLRILLALLGYILITKLIPTMTFLEFVCVSLIFEFFEYLVSIFKRL